jgi:protein MBA1
MAKALHREMLEAFAAGDQATLRRICTKQFAAQLGAAISKRDPRERTTFELMSYNKPLFYPRLKSHLLLAGFLPDKDVVLEQAVVAIASTQKASKQEIATGATVPGSVRLQDKIEYVVLTRYGSHATYEVEPWRVWGTTSPTTLDGWNEYLDVQNKEQAFRSGYKQRASE